MSTIKNNSDINWVITVVNTGVATLDFNKRQFFVLHTKKSLYLQTFHSSLGLWAFVAVAALLASKSTYLRHEQGGQGLIAGTTVLDCGVCSCLGLVQTLFISTFVGSHTHTTHARL